MGVGEGSRVMEVNSRLPSSVSETFPIVMTAG